MLYFEVPRKKDIQQVDVDLGSLRSREHSH